MSEGQVWECDDLKKYIFSFLRKTPRLICNCCNKVLIWDRKVNDYIMITWSTYKNNVPNCIDCWYNNYNGPGCVLS